MPEGKSIASWLPVTKEDLRKHTLASMLFLCLIVISILYTRSQKQSEEIDDERILEINALKQEVKQLRTEVIFMHEQMRRSDSALSDVKATLRALEKYGRTQ